MELRKSKHILSLQELIGKEFEIRRLLMSRKLKILLIHAILMHMKKKRLGTMTGKTRVEAVRTLCLLDTPSKRTTRNSRSS